MVVKQHMHRYHQTKSKTQNIFIDIKYYFWSRIFLANKTRPKKYKGKVSIRDAKIIQDKTRSLDTLKLETRTRLRVSFFTEVGG